MMILTALGYAMVFVLLVIVTVFISAKIESKITFKEIIDGFKRRWESPLWALSSFSLLYFYILAWLTGPVIFARSLYFLLDEIKNNKEVRTMWIKELKLMTLVYEMYSSGKTKDYILSKTNISSDDYERYIAIGNKFKHTHR